MGSKLLLIGRLEEMSSGPISQHRPKSAPCRPDPFFPSLCSQPTPITPSGHPNLRPQPPTISRSILEMSKVPRYRPSDLECRSLVPLFFAPACWGDLERGGMTSHRLGVTSTPPGASSRLGKAAASRRTPNYSDSLSRRLERSLRLIDCFMFFLLDKRNGPMLSFPL
jgi:hypothetical protein